MEKQIPQLVEIAKRIIVFEVLQYRRQLIEPRPEVSRDLAITEALERHESEFAK